MKVNQPSHDDVREWDLLGYVLGALDADEQEQLDEVIADDPGLQLEIQQLKESMASLDGLVPPSPPPAGLARRTCESIALVCGPRSRSRPATERVQSTGFSDRERTVIGSRTWSLGDLVVFSVVALVLGGLIVPAVYLQRLEGLKVGCQANLSRLGLAMMDYSTSFGGRGLFEHPLQENEKLALAGVFGPTLREAGLLEEQELFCPERSRQETRRLPTIDDIKWAEGELLARLQREICGDYAMSIGYMDKGQYRAPRNLKREWFVLFADMPGADSPGRASSNHGGRGQNVCFEDGHTAFIPVSSIGRDAIYENDQCEVAPGLSENDIVVVPGQYRLQSIMQLGIAD